MRQYLRARVEGATYFFTVVTNHRRKLLTTERARRCLREAWRSVALRRPFRLDAVCLMPDHLHCLWTLSAGDADYSTRWAAIKALFSKAYLAGDEDLARNASRRRTGEAALWQRRFWEHVVRDDEDFTRHADYVHYNAVKHGCVSRPADWPWSTFRRYVTLGYYDPRWGETEPASVNGLDVPE